jgi:primary-amine oxidase
MPQISSLAFRMRCLSCWVALAWLGAGLLGRGEAFAADHPLDPLSQDEIRATVEILKASGKITPTSRFSLILLHEPPKHEVLNFKPGSDFRREAFAVVYERASNKTSEAMVDLRSKKLLSWRDVPGVQPSFLEEDAKILQEVVHADPRWQEAMRKRGITDFDNVEIDDWAAGYFGSPETDGIRVRIAVCQYRGNPKNYMGRPIEGVVAYVDLNARKIIKFIDTGVVPVPQGTPGFDAKSIGSMRQGPRPLAIAQAGGASFEVHGHEVRWQKWRFRFGMNAREGLVLSTVGYEDQGRVRSVLYRASLSEMVVPYGDPAPGWFIKNAFDEGEDLMGRYAAPLEPLTDVPANAALFDAVFADEHGAPVEFRRAVALYERDGGVLWKHFVRDRMYNASRRSRELVLGWIATVGNYDYGFNWVFHQDGRLEMEVLLTGFMETKAVRAATASESDPEAVYGHLVAPQVDAVNHQHFFNFRLDMDVDGAENSVEEVNVEPAAAGPGNPQRNAFLMQETLFRREHEAERQVNPATSRAWKVINPNLKNALGEPVGYILMPEENSFPYADADAWIRKRAGFMNAHLWVTPYAPDELYAAGFYANQSKGDDGLPKWTEANRSIENQDIVLWYTLGVTHMPRPEEWPIMPVHRAGFELLPFAFFDRNPALDVPKPK